MQKKLRFSLPAATGIMLLAFSSPLVPQEVERPAADQLKPPSTESVEQEADDAAPARDAAQTADAAPQIGRDADTATKEVQSLRSEASEPEKDGSREQRAGPEGRKIRHAEQQASNARQEEESRAEAAGRDSSAERSVFDFTEAIEAEEQARSLFGGEEAPGEEHGSETDATLARDAGRDEGGGEPEETSRAEQAAASPPGEAAPEDEAAAKSGGFEVTQADVPSGPEAADDAGKPSRGSIAEIAEALARAEREEMLMFEGQISLTEPEEAEESGEGRIVMQETVRSEAPLSASERRALSHTAVRVLEHALRARRAIEADLKEEALHNIEQALVLVEIIDNATPVEKVEARIQSGDILYVEEKTVKNLLVPVYSQQEKRAVLKAAAGWGSGASLWPAAGRTAEMLRDRPLRERAAILDGLAEARSGVLGAGRSPLETPVRSSAGSGERLSWEAFQDNAADGSTHATQPAMDRG